MDTNLLPDRLISIRKKNGLNKAEAARLLNLSKMGYGRYESGERSPSPQMLELIAQKFGTSVAYLTGNSASPDVQYIIVSKEKNSSLFSLVTELQTCDQKTLDRLLAYYRLLTKKESP